MVRRFTNVTQRPRPATTPQFTTAAPIRGLNTVDPPAVMAPEFALSLQNFIAAPSGLEFREGYREWASGMPTSVTSLIAYRSGTGGSNKLFAVSGSAIYDVTNGGTVGAAAVSGLNVTAPYWQYAHQTHTANGNHYLIAVNGADAPRMYDGSAWTTCTQVASPSAPGQFKTGSVNIADLIDVVLHQQRLWFVAKNSTKGWYLDLGAVGGDLKQFDFGPLFANGGTLHKLESWTIDNGGTAASQAQLVAISSQGDVVVYPGNDPATAATWGPPGTYKVGSPVGRRCTSRRAGDVLVLSNQGLFAMSRLVQSTRIDVQQTISYNIAPTIANFASSLSGLPGFEVVEYPGRNLLILNVPQANQEANFQFVMNTITGGWSQFTNWPARCFTLLNESMYFGANGKVMLSFIGYKDGATILGTSGDNIIATCLTAFHTMGDMGAGLQKHVKLVKPMIQTGDTSPVIRIGVNTDYNLVPIVGASTINPVTGGIWNVSLWNNPSSTWAGSLTTYNQWVTPTCYPGEALALAISVSASAETRWNKTLWMIEPGAIFG